MDKESIQQQAINSLLQGWTTTNTPLSEYNYDPATTNVQYPYYPVYASPADVQIQQLAKYNSELERKLKMLGEYMLIEKAKADGLDVVQIMKLLNSETKGDRQIAIALVNDKILTEILE